MICPFTTADGVALPGDQKVIAGPAIQIIRATSILARIVRKRTHKRVISGTTHQDILTMPRQDQVIAPTPFQSVIARPTDKGIIPLAPNQMVGATLYLKDIISTCTDQNIISGTTYESVICNRPCQAVVTSPPFRNTGSGGRAGGYKSLL